MKRLMGIIFMIITVMAMLGCGGDSDTGGGKKSIITEPGLAAKIITELKEQSEFKGKEIKVFNNVVVSDTEEYGNTISIDVLVPGTSDKVDKYIYMNGKWQNAGAAFIPDGLTVKDNLMPNDAIDYSKIPEMYKVAEEKAKSIENGKVEKSVGYIYYAGNHSYKAYILIDGSKESYSTEFDAKGNFVKFIDG